MIFLLLQEAKDKTTSYLKEKTGITHKFDKNGRLVGEVPRTEDYNVSKTVGEVNYMVNGKLKSPQNLLNEIWSRKSSVKTGSADERTFIALTGKTIKKVAVLGGAGSFATENAKLAGADAFISSDFKYHEFFDAEEHLIIADIGHYESEQFTSELLAEQLTENFPNFAVRLTKLNTNPVNYL